MKRKFLLFFVLAAAFIASQNASAVLVTFDDLPLNQVYNVGNYCTPLCVDLQVQQFFPVAGGSISGTALVGDYRTAGASGKELVTNGTNLELSLDFDGFPASGIALMFSDTGGDINLGINGDLRKAANFTDLPSVIGGANIYIAGGYPFGILMITGANIQKLTIGGHGISIDNAIIEVSSVPEPVTVVLLGLGGLGLLFRKKKEGQAC